MLNGIRLVNYDFRKIVGQLFCDLTFRTEMFFHFLFVEIFPTLGKKKEMCKSADTALGRQCPGSEW